MPARRWKPESVQDEPVSVVERTRPSAHSRAVAAAHVPRWATERPAVRDPSWDCRSSMAGSRRWCWQARSPAPHCEPPPEASRATRATAGAWAAWPRPSEHVWCLTA